MGFYNILFILSHKISICLEFVVLILWMKLSSFYYEYKALDRAFYRSNIH